MNKQADSLSMSAQKCMERRKKEYPPFVIDLRSADEYRAGHIAGSRLIPAEKLESRLDQLPPNTAVIVYDQEGGESSQKAAQALKDFGVRKAFFIEGGYESFSAAVDASDDKIEKFPVDQWVTEIEKLFEGTLKPMLQEHGGGITVKSAAPGDLKLQYMGSCATCEDSINGTLKLIHAQLQGYFNHEFKISLV
ncbi:MAG: rhodanese-like domain-containing protein [bacterium]|nr:rhodanese-like domain-containing protein [bacterium]